MDPIAFNTGSLASIPIERMAGNSSAPEADKIAEMARQFEAVLLRQILTSARKSVSESEDGEPSTTNAIYDDMVNQQLADAISRSGDFGLAKSLTRELVRQTRPGTQPAVPGEGAEASTPASPSPSGAKNERAGDVPPPTVGDVRSALNQVSRFR